MAKRPTAGNQFHLVAFDRRTEVADDYGNTVGQWAEQFQTRAEYVHKSGSETVIAARLQGRHTQIIRVRASAAARAVTTDWRVRDVRNGQFIDGEWRGTEFNIRYIMPDEEGRQWLDFHVEKGVVV